MPDVDIGIWKRVAVIVGHCQAQQKGDSRLALCDVSSEKLLCEVVRPFSPLWGERTITALAAVC